MVGEIKMVGYMVTKSRAHMQNHFSYDQYIQSCPINEH